MSIPAETSAPPADPPAERLHPLRRVILYGVYAGMMLLCLAFLRQWGSSHPWSRLDVFSGGFLACNVLFRIRGLLSRRGRLKSKAAVREASGLTFDPRSAFWMRFLGLAQPVVMLDYGQLHLAPVLENPVLQGVGLGLYLLAELGWVWVDTHLLRQFYADLDDRALVTEGPYRRVRHPRYTCLLLGRSGIALIFASPLGWLLTLGWLVLLLRRIPMEEVHLGKIFGEEYDAYSRRSSRLLPGVY
jgi:protein-S-isoprenylcysteine O-methyltransferase Ste14